MLYAGSQHLLEISFKLLFLFFSHLIFLESRSGYFTNDNGK